MACYRSPGDIPARVLWPRLESLGQGGSTVRLFCAPIHLGDRTGGVFWALQACGALLGDHAMLHIDELGTKERHWPPTQPEVRSQPTSHRLHGNRSPDERESTGVFETPWGFSQWETLHEIEIGLLINRYAFGDRMRNWPGG